MDTLSESFRFDIDEVQLQLQEQKATCAAEQFHGYLCGLLASGKRLNAEKWLEQAAEWMEVPKDQFAGPFESWLFAFYEFALTALSEMEEMFTPLMDEDAYLRSAAEALALWCESFIFGIGHGLSNEQMAEGEVAEIFSDLSAISQLEVPEDPDESDQEAFMEVYEFVRVAVMNIHLQFDPTQQSKTDQFPPQ